MPASREELASVLDARLTEIWAELFQVPRERWDHELIGWFLRAAYGQGYCDALREPAGGIAHAGARLPVGLRDGLDGFTPGAIWIARRYAGDADAR